MWKSLILLFTLLFATGILASEYAMIDCRDHGGDYIVRGRYKFEANSLQTNTQHKEDSYGFILLATKVKVKDTH